MEFPGPFAGAHGEGEGGCRLDRRCQSGAGAGWPRESRLPPAGPFAAGFVDGQIRQAASPPRDIRPHCKLTTIELDRVARGSERELRLQRDDVADALAGGHAALVRAPRRGRARRPASRSETRPRVDLGAQHGLLGEDGGGGRRDLGEAAGDDVLRASRPPATTRTTPGRSVVRNGAWFGMAVKSPSDAGDLTAVAATEASLRSGLTRSNCRVSAIRRPPQAASAAMRSAFFTTSSMPPTM